MLLIADLAVLPASAKRCDGELYSIYSGLANGKTEQNAVANFPYAIGSWTAVAWPWHNHTSSASGNSIRAAPRKRHAVNPIP